MDAESQNSNSVSPQQRLPDFTKPQSAKHHIAFSLLGIFVLIIGMSAVYLWQHQKVHSLDQQIANMNVALIKDASLSEDNLDAVLALPNIVVDTSNSPTDLIAFLGADNTQCYKGGGSGYYKVIAQVNDKFAEMQYGCTAKGGTTPLGSTPTHILAKKDNNTWKLISPTNQWLPISGQDTPSCVMVNKNQVSKLVTPECWQGPALVSPSYNIGKHTVVQVTNP